MRLNKSACLLDSHLTHLYESTLNSSQFVDIGVLNKLRPQAVMLVNPEPDLLRCVTLI